MINDVGGKIYCLVFYIFGIKDFVVGVKEIIIREGIGVIISKVYY